MAREDRVPSGITKMCWRTFWSKREHGSTSESVTSEPYLGLPARFEIDRAGAQSEVLVKTGVSDLSNRIVRFWQIQPSPVAHVNDKDRTNLHLSGVWAREGKDRG
jgi:hypothetical protein